uniref:Uncharacterized protein n=1 Tax=Tanacetum cinerariifolium TaxID=118510 RepID=A0A6L2MR21_TANCI|nr:hypothetical protein [Tanacetum cinerariifolium]
MSITSSNKPRLSEAEDFILPNHDTGKVLPDESQRNTTDPSVVVTHSSVTDYDLADESLVYSAPLPPLEKMASTKLKETLLAFEQWMLKAHDLYQKLLAQTWDVPGPEVMYGDDSTYITEGYGHVKLDHILKWDIEFHFIPTNYQLADIFTKPFDEPTFKLLIVELASFIIHSELASGYDASVDSTTEADLGKSAPCDFILQQQVIKELLVKTKQKGAILDLKQRHLKNIIFCYYTSYASEALNHQVDYQTYRRAKKVRKEPQDHRITLVIFAQPNTLSIKTNSITNDTLSLLFDHELSWTGSLEKKKARRRGQEYNWETATYGKIWYDEDIYYIIYFKKEFSATVYNDTLTSEPEVLFDFENEYPAIVYNNTLTSKPKVSIDFENEFPAIVYNDASISELEISAKPTVSSYPAIKIGFDFKISLSDSDDEDYTFIYDKNSSSNKLVSINNLKSYSNNDDDKIDIKQSSGDLSVEPLPTVIKINAQLSNKLLETSHDTTNKLFKTNSFKELGFNIMTCNFLTKGMPFVFIIKNLYVPFGFPFDPKLFYKDGIKLEQV